MKNDKEKETILTLFHQLRKLNEIRGRIYKKHQEYSQLCNDILQLIANYAPFHPDQLIVNTQTNEIRLIHSITPLYPELMDLIPRYSYTTVLVARLDEIGDYCGREIAGVLDNKQIKQWRALTPDEVYQFRKGLPQKGVRQPRRTKEK